MTQNLLPVQDLVRKIANGLVNPSILEAISLLVDNAKEEHSESPFLKKLSKASSDKPDSFDLMSEIGKFTGVVGSIKGHLNNNFDYLLEPFDVSSLNEDQEGDLRFLNIVSLSLAAFNQHDLIKRLQDNLISELTSNFPDNSGITAFMFHKAAESMMTKTMEREIVPALNTRVPGGAATMAQIFNALPNLI